MNNKSLNDKQGIMLSGRKRKNCDEQETADVRYDSLFLNSDSICVSSLSLPQQPYQLTKEEKKKNSLSAIITMKRETETNGVIEPDEHNEKNCNTANCGAIWGNSIYSDVLSRHTTQSFYEERKETENSTSQYRSFVQSSSQTTKAIQRDIEDGEMLENDASLVDLSESGYFAFCYTDKNDKNKASATTTVEADDRKVSEIRMGFGLEHKSYDRMGNSILHRNSAKRLHNMMIPNIIGYELHSTFWCNRNICNTVRIQLDSILCTGLQFLPTGRRNKHGEEFVLSGSSREKLSRCLYCQLQSIKMKKLHINIEEY